MVPHFELTKLIKSTLSDLHKLNGVIMAEKMECETDDELFVWREKLLTARESDKKLNNFMSRHRSQSAPRGTSDRGRSLSDERKDLPSSHSSQTEEVGRRSRRQSRLDGDVSDKESKDKETEIQDHRVSLNRDRSPLIGKFAETGRKVISKLKSPELSDSLPRSLIETKK